MAKKRKKNYLGKARRKGGRRGFFKKRGFSTSSASAPMKRGKKKKGGGAPMGNPVIYTKTKFLTHLWVGSAAFGAIIGWLTKANLPGANLAPKSGAGKEITLALAGITAGFIVGKKHHKTRKWLAIGTSSALSIAGYKVGRASDVGAGAIQSINNIMGQLPGTIPAPGTPASVPTATPGATPVAVPSPPGAPAPVNGYSVQGYSVQGYGVQGAPIGQANENPQRELRWAM